jgi:hypothetical protein
MSGPFSVACDVSNTGKLKFYPVAIRYSELERAEMLDFREDSGETFEAIANKVKRVSLKTGMLEKQLSTVYAIAWSITGISRHL